jgi:hypothetical protein
MPSPRRGSPFHSLAGMNRALWPAATLIIVAIVAAGLSAASGIGFWWAFLIVAVALLINGWLATLEDDLSGGFNNPDGTQTPKYAVITGWVIRGLGVVLALLCVGALALHFFGAR